MIIEKPLLLPLRRPRGGTFVPRYVVIVNPQSKRWRLYAHELETFWARQGMRPEIRVVPWRELIPRNGDLDGIDHLDSPALVRIESPGRDVEVMNLLLEAGTRETPDEVGWRDVAYRKGLLLRPGLMYRGFARLLRGVRTSLDARPQLQPLACPLAIAELFDKSATAQRLTAHGIPVATSWPPPENAATLLGDLRRRRVKTAYVKLNTGSSASGIAVVHPLDDPPWAVTSLIQIDGHFHGTRRLQQVRGADMEAVLDFLLREGAVIQQGISMAQIDGQNFDVRVVMLYGRPAFTVFRLSSQPMTNLHLGGRRGRPEECRPSIPTRAWLDALDHCTEAARLYPCAMLGIDLLFERGYLNHYLLEINAFGDFFPGLTDDRGRTIYQVEIEETVRRYGLC